MRGEDRHSVPAGQVSSVQRLLQQRPEPELGGLKQTIPQVTIYLHLPKGESDQMARLFFDIRLFATM